MAEISPLATQQQILDLIQAQRDSRKAAFRERQSLTQDFDADFGATLQVDAEIEQTEFEETTARLDLIEQAREEQLQADLEQLSFTETEPGDAQPASPQDLSQDLPRGSIIDLLA